MRIEIKELTPGCGEWCACLFNQCGQAIISVKSIKSAKDAEDRLEEGIGKIFTLLKEGEDIVSGLEAEADNAHINLEEVRHWWQRANSVIQLIERRS